MAEIAENYGITRQGVRDAIKHGEATLMEMEETAGLLARRTEAHAGRPGTAGSSWSARCACCNTGLYDAGCPQFSRDTDEMLTIIRRLTPDTAGGTA
ncbi:MAG: hypothetical protein ACLUW8_14130 [Subdoligranulum sp.]